jgi:hypothetical protein
MRIMENISENTPRKRGRPPTLPAAERRISMQEQRNRSPRHRNNYLYAIRAISTLCDDPRFEWLLSDGPTLMAGKGHMRHTLLSALGRIDDEQDREAMALYLCEHQPTTRQAVALIRQVRLGTRPQGSSAQLAEVLRRTIATYQAEHEPLADDELVQALHAVTHDILMALDQ